MLICGSQNISFFHIEIKLEVARNDITKVDFMIALNRILTHARTPYGDN